MALRERLRFNLYYKNNYPCKYNYKNPVPSFLLLLTMVFPLPACVVSPLIGR